jgi:hypothetical protein
MFLFRKTFILYISSISLSSDTGELDVNLKRKFYAYYVKSLVDGNVKALLGPIF